MRASSVFGSIASIIPIHREIRKHVFAYRDVHLVLENEDIKIVEVLDRTFVRLYILIQNKCSIGSLERGLLSFMFSLNERVNPWKKSAKQTQFRKRTLVGIFVLTAMVGYLFIQWNASSVSAASQPVRYVVKAGDTLWSISASIAGNNDTRDILDEIEGMNHLDEANHIVPGQVLLVPSK
jgi:hypothetical protein